MTRKAKAPDTRTVRTLLDRHGCPVPFHAVRTRLLGNIATPVLGASPLRAVEALWGGELPEFDNMADAEVLFATLLQGLWNDLARHQKRSQPFRLTRLTMDLSAADLRRFAEVRLQEIDGFLDGLFREEAEIDLPERAHLAVGMLQKMRGMMAGVVDLVDRDFVAHELSDDEQGQIAATFEQLREMTRIMETEIHEAVLSCARARRQGLTGTPTASPVLH